MKYTKINYCIIGRFVNGGKYGIVSRQEVDGYKVDGLDGIAIRKRNGFWYVDHIATGMGIVTVGSKTREAAVNEYKNHYMELIQNADRKMLKNAVETFENAPLESDIATWDVVNYCTTYNYRFDRVTNVAKKAGLIIKKADDVSYLDGGNINIIGKPEALETIREMIKAWEEHDAERAEIISEAQDTPETAAPADDPKPARGPVPEKTFIGETIQGNGWKIFFDGEASRTRVIFEGMPTEAARAAIENAGFYYSSIMNSWNKKLTFKAYRAAKVLSDQLSELYAA